VCAIDAETLETRVIKVTGRRIGDASMHPDLPDQIAGNQPIGLVTAAGAYDTRACHAAIAPRGAAAVIPPRNNGMETAVCRGGQTLRCPSRLPTIWSHYLEAMDRLPPTKSGRSQDALLHALGPARHVPRL